MRLDYEKIKMPCRRDPGQSFDVEIGYVVNDDGTKRVLPSNICMQGTKDEACKACVREAEEIAKKKLCAQ